MRKLIYKFIHWVKNQIRKKNFKKRQAIYDDVITKLDPHLKKKKLDQDNLIELIKTNFKKDTGVSYESKFIPFRFKNHKLIHEIIYNKYGEQMHELGVHLNNKLQLRCIY